MNQQPLTPQPPADGVVTPTPRVKLAFELWWQREKAVAAAQEIGVLKLLIVMVGVVLVVLALVVVGAADQVVPVLRHWPLIP